MKNLLLFLAVILCSLNTFGQGAQYRPTPFANGFVQTVTSTGTAQTYLGIGSSTNNALLNGTNVFTGTNTFNTNLIFGSSTLQTQLDSKPTVALTNLALLNGTNTFSTLLISQGGDSGWTNLRSFYRSTGLGIRELFTTNISLTFIDCATNSTAPYTNNGLKHCSGVISFTSPALLGSNSTFAIRVGAYKTNATASSPEAYFWVGPTTNFAGRISSLTSGATVQRWLTLGAVTVSTTTASFRNYGSYTNQIPGNYNGNDVLTDVPLGLVDTSQPFQVYIGWTSTSGATNVGIWMVEAGEFVKTP